MSNKNQFSSPRALNLFLTGNFFFKGHCNHSQVISFDEETEITGAEFRTQVAGLLNILTDYPSGRWCLYCHDSYAFTVGLFALLHSNQKALLAPNLQPDTLETITPTVTGVITDLCIELKEKPVINPLLHKVHLNQNPSFNPIDPLTPLIELMTSGSTGIPKLLSKNLNILTNEVNIHYQLWGSSHPAARVFSTVSHQHIYGLLFKILHPIAAGQPFYRQTIQYPEILPSLFSKHPACILLSSPTHLKRLPELIKIEQLSGHCKVIFSSTGNLSSELATKIAKGSQAEVIEVFGSTETGGIAYRKTSQLTTESNWTIFPSLLTRINPLTSALQIQSPFILDCQRDQSGWYNSNDAVEINTDGTLTLLGRIDDIVKVEGKRLSLIELQQYLMIDDFIEDAEVILLESCTQLANRDTVCAILVLSAEGEKMLARCGRAGLSQHFRISLAKHFEPVLLPRRYRYVKAIPRDSQGKRKLIELKSLCAHPHFIVPLEKTLLPIVKSELYQEHQLTLELEIPPDLAYLEGHFPQNPIVPAFVQVDWVMYFLNRYFLDQLKVGKIITLKFLRPILPNITCQLKLDYNKERNLANYTYTSQGDLYGVGRILLQPGGCDTD